MEKFDLHTIWEGCKVQNRNAQAILYSHFSKKMYAVCLRYTHTTSEAEDILQNSFIKVFTKTHLYAGQGSLEGWIKRIIIHTCIEHYRTQKIRFTDDINSSQIIELKSDIGLDQTDYKDLLALIQQMPVGYMTVFNMFVIEGYSHKEIAEILEITEGSSKSQLARARAWLQKKLMYQTV